VVQPLAFFMDVTDTSSPFSFHSQSAQALLSVPSTSISWLNTCKSCTEASVTHKTIFLHPTGISILLP